MKKPDSQSLLKWGISALLALVTLAAYVSVAENDFVNMDDPGYVTQNVQVQQGFSWNTVRWAMTAEVCSNWHPLTWLSHALDYQLYGLNPAGPHLTNLAFHVANTILLFLLLQRLTTRLWPATFVALLFGLHPMHVESVAWVSERKDVLSGLFFLLTLLAYTRYGQSMASGEWRVARGDNESKAESGKRERGSQISTCNLQPATCNLKPTPWALYCLSLLCFALGVMSKPMLVTLPCVLLLLDYWPLNRFQVSSFKFQVWFEKIPFFLLSALSCWVTIVAQARNYAVVPTADLSLGTRLAHVLVAYAWYLGKLFWPVNLSAYYWLYIDRPDADEMVIAAFFLLVVLTALVGWRARRETYLLVGWLWFLVMLVPVIGIVQVGNQAYADRYTYLPYIGLFIGLVWGVPAFLSRWCWHKPVLWLTSLIVAVVFFQLTVARVRDWKNGLTIYQQMLVQDQNNVVAWYGLGNIYLAQGNLDKAIEAFNQTTTINLGFHRAWNNLGGAYYQQGKYDEAQNAFEMGLLNGREQKPELYRNLAGVFLKTGKFGLAISNYQNSLELNPDQPQVLTDMGKSFLANQQPELAAAEFEQALRLQPDNSAAEFGLGTIEAGAGRVAGAIQHYRRAIGDDTNSVIALNNLAWALATTADAHLRNGAEAVQLAQRACQLTRYQTTIFIGTLAAAYAEAGDFDRAVATAHQACDVAAKNGQPELLAKNQQLMKLYRAHQRVRE